MHRLDISGVTKRYGSATALDDLSFSVEPGRVTGFLGPNGAGKSTLIKILLGLASPDRGTALIAGKTYRELTEPTRTVGALVQPDAFHPARTGRDHLQVVADATGIESERIDHCLEIVGLTGAARRRVGGYSMGMKQRLGLAAALLGDPPVLVLDEPGNGLDPQGTRWLRGVLRQRAADGGTVLVSSHLLAEMEQLADDLVIIRHGRLVTSGKTADLRGAGTSVRTPSPRSLTALVRGAGGTVQETDDDALVITGISTPEIGDLAQKAGVALHELTPRSGSLESLFFNWTEDNEGAGDAPIAKEMVSA